MNTNLSKTFEEEFLSFFALYLMNLVFAALAMAIGLTIIVQQYVSPTGLPSMESSPGLGGVSAILGAVAFVLGLIWITATAKLMKSVKVVRKAYRERKKREMTSEDFTGMMVHMMTQYRDQKRMIRAMVFICLAGGIVFAGQGVLGIAVAIAGIASGSAMLTVLVAILGGAINLVLGGASILVSKYFRRYASVWDARLDALARSESELKQMLEKA